MKRKRLFPYTPVPNWTELSKELALKELGYPSFQDQLRAQQEQIIEQLHQDQMEALEKNIKENLAKLGHTFTTREEFLQFMKERITRVQPFPATEPFEIYLDFDVKTKTGTLIARYSTQLNVEHRKNKVTFTLG